MYEAHFGLKSRPFGSKAEGAAVFVGPQQAKIMTSLKKGLAAQDAVVTVTGPVGVGKTTIVSRALESLSPGRMMAWVGRMQLGPEEVVELLLAGFGIQRKGAGTIRRFAAFRRMLNERAQTGIPVAIVVEDAQRLGADALAEIEALTAADNGDATSANIILMGQPGLHQLLARPELARMKQRNRLRQSIDAFTAAEVGGYLKHCIRHAGGNYDEIFAPGVADIVFACSEGIPRVINTLCESALSSAMDDAANMVTAALMHQVAADAFGYDGPLPADAMTPGKSGETSTASHSPASASETGPPVRHAVDIDREADSARAHESEPPARAVSTPVAPTATSDQPDELNLPRAARNIVVESGRYPELPAIESVPPGPTKTRDSKAVEARSTAASAPAAGPADSPAADDDDFEIPELINDTQPELTVLSPPRDSAAAAGRSNASAKADRQTPTPAADGIATNTVKAGNAGQPTAAGDNDDDADDDNFDLDAALTIDVEETNLMQGITGNLEGVAVDAQPDANVSSRNSGTAPVADDLPTLSNSMRVDVKKEVQRAKVAEANATGQPATTTPAAPKARDRGKAAEPAIAAPAKPPAAAKPAQPKTVGEMTARIAAINPGKRGDGVDALEAALDAARKGNLDKLAAAPVPPPVNGKDTNAKPLAEKPAPSIPAITLDEKLAERRKPSKQELDQYAQEISKANSLEQFSDAMAETLFGNEEFNQIAAEVVANPPPGHSTAVAESGLGIVESTPDHELAEPPPAGPSPVQLDDSLILEIAGVRRKPAPYANNSAGDELRESQAMRMDMLKALKDGVGNLPTEKIELGRNTAAKAPPAPKGPQPEPIENQIDTSITQTLKSLKLPEPAPAADGGDEKDKKPGGLFSRFRRSS